MEQLGKLWPWLTFVRLKDFGARDLYMGEVWAPWWLTLSREEIVFSVTQQGWGDEAQVCPSWIFQQGSKGEGEDPPKKREREIGGGRWDALSLFSTSSRNKDDILE